MYNLSQDLFDNHSIDSNCRLIKLVSEYKDTQYIEAVREKNVAPSKKSIKFRIKWQTDFRGNRVRVQNSFQSRLRDGGHTWVELKQNALLELEVLYTEYVGGIRKQSPIGAITRNGTDFYLRFTTSDVSLQEWAIQLMPNIIKHLDNEIDFYLPVVDTKAVDARKRTFKKTFSGKRERKERRNMVKKTNVLELKK